MNHRHIKPLCNFNFLKTPWGSDRLKPLWSIPSGTEVMSDSKMIHQITMAWFFNLWLGFQQVIHFQTCVCYLWQVAQVASPFPVWHKHFLFPGYYSHDLCKVPSSYNTVSDLHRVPPGRPLQPETWHKHCSRQEAISLNPVQSFVLYKCRPQPSENSASRLNRQQCIIGLVAAVSISEWTLLQ